MVDFPVDLPMNSMVDLSIVFLCVYQRISQHHGASGICLYSILFHYIYMPVNIYAYIPYYSILYIPKNLTFPISIRGLECTELPPYADALRSETKLPVFDAITNADCRGGGRGRGATVEKSSGKAMDFLPWQLHFRWKFLDFLQGKYANLQKIPENSDVFSMFFQRM